MSFQTKPNRNGSYIILTSTDIALYSKPSEERTVSIALDREMALELAAEIARRFPDRRLSNGRRSSD